MASRRKSVQISQSRDRISLNPEREAEDERDCEAVLQDLPMRDVLESAWAYILHHGDALRRQRCDAGRFRAFVERSGLSVNDRQMNVAVRNFGMQAADDDLLQFSGFVKVCLHLAMDRFPPQVPAVAGVSATVASRLASMRKLIDAHITPFVESCRVANSHDGSGPDDVLLSIPEIDRLLYVYDAVFERLYVRYRDVDNHQTRDLTLEQVKILDQYLEMEEVKEFLKDYGIFPKLISFVEVSKACQMACFGGRVVVDPTKQGPSRTSNIVAESKNKEPQVGVNVAALPAVETDESVATNALFIPQLPAEYRTSEVLLDKPRFMSCVIRLAQMMYGKPEFAKSAPSIVARVDEFLQQLAPTYEKMFHKTMESDCDYSEKGVPLLNNVSATAALSPDSGPMKGGFEITVNGSNFCEKRGVFVRFGSSGNVVVRAKQIQKKRVIVDAPSMRAEDVEVDIDFQHGEYHVYFQEVCKVAVECSNNRWSYSDTDPAQYFTFRDTPRRYTLGVELSAQLMKIFSAMCAYGDAKHTGTKHLSRDKWREFKRIANLQEVSRKAPSQDAETTSDGNNPGDPNDVFFLEVAEYHADGGGHELSLSFKAFLRALSRTLFSMHGEGWLNACHEVGQIQLTTQRHIAAASPVTEQNEFVLARRQIAMVERRSVLELDVFMGPVLCGTLRSRPGAVCSTYSGKPTVHIRSHPFLAYEHLEINTESCILRHLQMSLSIAHFLQRLRTDGFDVAAHHAKPTTRKPAGRCWGVYVSNGDSEKVLGALWDYEGNFSCLEWQPADKEMYHPRITMSIYEEEKSVHFVACYLCVQKSNDIPHLRSMLESKGLILKTKLYRVP